MRETTRRPLNEERRRLILSRLQREGRVLVSELASELDISAVTIRNDLNELARQGLLKRAHGGAVRVEYGLESRVSAQPRSRSHTADLSSIAAKAATMVHDGQTVVLNAGPTNPAIARALSRKQGLTIITNSLRIAYEIGGRNGADNGLNLVLTGGVLRREGLFLDGPLTGESLERLSGDILFLNVAGVDPEIGCTASCLNEARVAEGMVQISRQVVVTGGGDLFGRRSLAVVCNLDSVDQVVTDDQVSPNVLSELRGKGLEVHVV